MVVCERVRKLTTSISTHWNPCVMGFSDLFVSSAFLFGFTETNEILKKIERVVLHSAWNGGSYTFHTEDPIVSLTTIHMCCNTREISETKTLTHTIKSLLILQEWSMTTKQKHWFSVRFPSSLPLPTHFDFFFALACIQSKILGFPETIARSCSHTYARARTLLLYTYNRLRLTSTYCVWCIRF